MYSLVRHNQSYNVSFVHCFYFLYFTFHTNLAFIVKPSTLATFFSSLITHNWETKSLSQCIDWTRGIIEGELADQWTKHQIRTPPPSLRLSENKIFLAAKSYCVDLPDISSSMNHMMTTRNMSGGQLGIADPMEDNWIEERISLEGK